MKKRNKNTYVLGRVSERSGPKGYIIGQFMGIRGFSENETDEVEVAWKKLTSKDGYSEGHFHKIGVEVNIVISGECQMLVNSDPINLKKGDYLIVYPESVLSKFSINEKVEMIIIKAPSVPNDKYEEK